MDIIINKINDPQSLTKITESESEWKLDVITFVISGKEKVEKAQRKMTFEDTITSSNSNVYTFSDRNQTNL